MTSPQFQYLFAPFTIGPLTVRNRIVVPGHFTMFMPLDGLPTERMLHYWLTKARGGVGLIITHVHNVLPRHTGAPPPAMQSDAIIPAYRRVVEALHAEGVKFLVQLNHMGGKGDSRLFGGVLMAPSAVRSFTNTRLLPDGETPHEMEVEDIKAVVEAFRQAAARAREAGFDGVEVYLHTEVTAEMIIGTAPDAVVIATGSRPLTPDIPRTSDAQVVDVWAVLAGEVRVHSGQRVVVIAGEHHIQALSTADVLAEKGCQVAVLTEALHAGAQLEGGTLELIYGRLLKKGVVITPLTAVKAIKSHGITTENVLTKQESGLEGVDMVVVAYGGQADDALYRAVKGQVDEVDLVGDAWAPRRLIDAIQDGARVGRRV